MPATRMKRLLTGGVAGILGLVLMLAPAWADIIHNDDVIINGGTPGLCIGFDCADGENFGSDTIRLKENNTRIHFEDTSTSSFPNADWRLIANDTGGGSAGELFALQDVTNNRRPFTVEANAPNSALYLDSSGRLGVGTNNPVLEVHAQDGDTPSLRLEQDTSSGFAPQTWDVAGNETNFIVRDVTGGSRLPFRIRAGAPTGSVDIRPDRVRIGPGPSTSNLEVTPDGVGVGTASPDALLHVGSTPSDPFVGNTDMFVTDEGAAVIAVRSGEDGPEFFMRTTPLRGFMGTSTLHPFEIRTNDKPRITIEGDTGNVGIGRGGAQYPLHFASGARVTHAGQFVNASDRAVKDDFLSADVQAVLQALVELPISTWRHIADDESVRHIGPTAQDFNAAFGFGGDEDTAISTVDADGVALASIQALYEIVQQMQAENAELKAEVDRLKEAVDR